MSENPYSQMIEIMQKQGSKFNPPSIKIAKVIHVEITGGVVTDIKIEVDDLPVDKDNIYISDYLLTKHQRKVILRGERIKFTKSNPVGSTEVSSNHSHSLAVVSVDEVPFELDAKAGPSYIQTEDTLKIDDLVAVMPVYDEQTYIILSRIRRID